MWVTNGAELGLIVVALILIGVFFLGSFMGQKDFKQQAIEHEYAEYCPDTGKWSWIGECE